MVNRYQRLRAFGPDEVSTKPTDLVMIGDVTTLATFGKKWDIAIPRIRKLVQRRREGGHPRKPYLEQFPLPIKAFEFFALYLESELLDWFIEEGTLDAYEVAERERSEASQDGDRDEHAPDLRDAGPDSVPPMATEEVEVP